MSIMGAPHTGGPRQGDAEISDAGLTVDRSRCCCSPTLRASGRPCPPKSLNGELHPRTRIMANTVDETVQSVQRNAGVRHGAVHGGEPSPWGQTVMMASPNNVKGMPRAPGPSSRVAAKRQQKSGHPALRWVGDFFFGGGPLRILWPVSGVGTTKIPKRPLQHPNQPKANNSRHLP